VRGLNIEYRGAPILHIRIEKREVLKDEQKNRYLKLGGKSEWSYAVHIKHD
jgi:hypothetical protein